MLADSSGGRATSGLLGGDCGGLFLVLQSSLCLGLFSWSTLREALGLDKALPGAACYRGPTFVVLEVSAAQPKVARQNLRLLCSLCAWEALATIFGPKWALV